MNCHNILESLDWSEIRSRLGLSTREVEVSRGICEGAKISEIARQLRIGVGTVKTYCRRLYRKLDVTSQCGLALVIASAGRGAAPVGGVVASVRR